MGAMSTSSAGGPAPGLRRRGLWTLVQKHRANFGQLEKNPIPTASMRRYLHDQAERDLRRKMVFIGGPRQVGKTTLARQLLPDPAGYLSWDVNTGT